MNDTGPVLLPVSGSGVVDATCAVLVTVPLLFGPVDGIAAVTGMLSSTPLAMLPLRVQLTRWWVASRLLTVQVQPVAVGVPWTTKPSGRSSVTVTPAAALGPSLRGRRVNVTFCPADAGAGLTVLVIRMSAPAVTWVLTVAVLLSGSGSGVPPPLTLAPLVMVPLPTPTLARNS